MDSMFAIPLAALTVSVASLLFTVLAAQRQAGRDRVAGLESDVRQLREDLSEAQRRLADCERERIELYQRLFQDAVVVRPAVSGPLP